MSQAKTFTGGCACSAVRYTVKSAPMFVNACHCRWCQRETGSAFALNALIETDRIEVTTGELETVKTPSHSGRGQDVLRCPSCKVALWSHYGGAAQLAFLRVGALDDPDAMPPDIHIYTASKQAWVVLPAGAAAVEAYYKSADYWPPASLERRRALFN